MTKAQKIKYIPIWTPQKGAQLNAIMCTWCPELLYGGARGGGKTDFLLGDYFQDVAEYGDKWRGIVFRRTLPELDDIINRSQELFAQTGADYSKTKKLWTFKNGATLRFRHLERDEDAQKYQGHAYCVASDTQIIMGDGSHKQIGDVCVGDYVMTLEGPRVVTDTVPEYLAPCVKLGNQVHPVWHPVLTASGWQSYASAMGIDSTEFEGLGRADHKLPSVTLSVKLATRIRYRDTGCRDSIGYRSGEEDCVFRLLSDQGWQRLSQSLRRDWWQVLLKSTVTVRSLLRGGLGYAESGLSIAQGFRGGCLSGYGLCDVRALEALAADQSLARKQGYAGERNRVYCVDGALGNTRGHSHQALHGYLHPYDETVHQAEWESSLVALEATPVGDRLVCDITVDSANHYISVNGVINKNTWIGFDEVGNFPDCDPVFKIFATLRSAHNVERKRIRLTANPGGPGHSWVKARYVDPAPGGLTPILDEVSGIERIFIPSKVTDNMILMQQDPGYVARLQQVGSAELVRAWLDGDWNAVQGAYFTEFGIHHVIPPFQIPQSWLRFGCFDWGSASPYCYLWIAVSDGRFVPKNSLVVYREDYGANPDGKGRKWTAEQVAENILHMQRRDETVYSVGDPSMFKEDGGPSIAERMAAKGLRMRPADNKRIAGWDAIRQRLRGAPDDYDGQKIKPLLYMFNTCKHLIRTLPNLQHDSRHPEDLDTTAEDHAADALRYGVMSRPYTIDTHHQPPMKGIESLTLDTLIAKETKKFGKYRSNRL